MTAVTWEEFIKATGITPDTVTIEVYQGPGAFGPVFSAPVQVGPCVVESARRRVPVTTAGAAGAEVVSQTTVRCPLGTAAPVDSRVTLPDGVKTRVLSRVVHDPHGLPLPGHVELLLE